MANKQTPRGGRQPHRPRTATALRRQQRQQRRRKALTSGIALAIIIAVVLALVLSFGANSNRASSTTTSSTSTTVAPSTTALPSAAGKPCVAEKGTAPAGAPAVTVQVGSPPTKLVTKDLEVGTGAVVKTGQTLSVDYIGVACSTGVIFDSSYKAGKPASFALSGVIQGWQQGIPGMKVGGERLLGIPSSLAYGTQGYPPDIAPNEALWFVVTVHSAK